METIQSESAEKKLDNTALFAKYTQYGLMLIFGGIIASRNELPKHLENYDYKEMVRYLALVGFLLSFVLDRAYVRAKKGLDMVKMLSQDEERARKVEHRARFLFSYFMWGLFYVIFSLN